VTTKRTARITTLALTLQLAAGTAAAADVRGYSASRFALQVDGQSAGALREASGGGAYAEVVPERPGPDGVVRKHLGPPKFEDITVVGGAGLSPGFWAWMRDMVEGRPMRRNGELIAADYNYKEQSAIVFDRALITEVTFPALDASSQDAVSLTVKLTPELTRRRKGSGASVQAKLDPKTKQWLSSNFRLTIDNLPAPRVARVESFSIKQRLADTGAGAFRDDDKRPGALELSNLVITLPEADAEPFQAWLEDSVVKGNGQERAASLELLGPDMKATLLQLDFQGVGITRITREPRDDASARVRIELYVETVKLAKVSDGK
jgi:hypothetical protein